MKGTRLSFLSSLPNLACLQLTSDVTVCWMRGLVGLPHLSLQPLTFLLQSTSGTTPFRPAWRRVTRTDMTDTTHLSSRPRRAGMGFGLNEPANELNGRTQNNMAVALRRNQHLGRTLVPKQRTGHQFSQIHGPQNELDERATLKRGGAGELESSSQSSQAVAVAAILARYQRKARN
jgi:hypothetical protein